MSEETFRLTNIQICILSAIMKGDGDGGFADIDQIIDRLPHKPSKASLQFSLRALCKRGFIEKKGLEKRRSRKRVTYDLTELSRSMYDATHDDFDIIVEE